MTSTKLFRHAAVALLALPALASAQQAFTTHQLNVRAGPAADYPVVTVLPAGASVMVQGCISDFSWCDVELPGGRGWVYAEYLSYPYQGNNVPVRNMGANIGIPILAFGLAAYWASNYRDRPWYHNQSQWDSHRPRPPYGGPPTARPPGIGHPPPRPPIAVQPPRPRPPTGVQPPPRPHPGDRPQNGRPPNRPQPEGRPPSGNQGHGGRPPGGGRPGGPGEEHRPGGSGPR